MKFIKFFINQSKVTNLIVFFIIIIGAIIFWRGQKEGFPQIQMDMIWISATYIGATAEEVEKLVTDKIEDAVAEVDGAKRITSRSIEGLSTVIYEVDSDYSKDFDKIFTDVKNAVDSIPDLPEDVKDPYILDINTDMFPVISVFIAGDIPEESLRKLSRKVEEDLKELKGVGKVEKWGYRKKQVWIEVDPDRLDYYDMNITDVIAAIRLRSINLPGGKISVSKKEYLIRTLGEYKNLLQVKNTIIRANDEGLSVRIMDVAKVSWNFEKDDTSFRVNGSTGINLNALKKKSGDTIKVADAVKNLIKRYKKEKLLPKGAKMFYSNDISFFVKNRLNILTQNAFVGLILIFLCLILFFDWKSTFWTILGIPIAFCGAMLIITMFDMTLNMVTMFGFIIVVGMIVDDAIIVSENIYRHREKGKTQMQSAVDGTSEVFKPVMATVVTTIAAFMPLVGLPGMMGKFLKFIPIVISITMLVSLIECVLILPGHIAHMRLKLKKKIKKGMKAKEKKQIVYVKEEVHEKRAWFKVLRKHYEKALTFLLRRPILNTIAISFIAFILLISLFIIIPKVFFSGDIDQFNVQIECNIDYSIEQTKNVVDRAERSLRKAIGKETKEFICTVGYWETSHGPRFRTHYVGIQIILNPNRKMKEEELRRAICSALDKIKGIDIYDARAVKGGPPQSSPIQVKVLGDNLDTLEKISEELRLLVDSISNTSSVKVSLEQGKDELVLDINEVKAATLGVNISSSALAVRNTFEGGIATVANSMENIDEEVDILVKNNEKKAKTLANLKTVQIKNMRGRYIPLNKFAAFKKKRSIAIIEHEDKKRIASVTAELANEKNRKYSSEAINKIIGKKLKPLQKKYPNYKIKIAGMQEDMIEMGIGAVKAGIIALILIYIILTALFKSLTQPIFVMMVIPFSMVGVLIALIIHNIPLGMLPVMGMVALMGVVVNDSLVLVSFVNRLRLEGKNKLTALIEAGKTRLRPIILTTITTIVGLIPMSYGIMGSESFLQPMGIALIWGLFFATTITLFILPCMYYVGDSLIVWIYSNVLKREFKLPGSLE